MQEARRAPEMDAGPERRAPWTGDRRSGPARGRPEREEAYSALPSFDASFSRMRADLPERARR